MVLVKAKTFLQKLSEIWTRAFKKVCRKMLKNIGFKGHQIMNLPGTPRRLELALDKSAFTNVISGYVLSSGTI
jgi:hypothetical protein